MDRGGLQVKITCFIRICSNYNKFYSRLGKFTTRTNYPLNVNKYYSLHGLKKKKKIRKMLTRKIEFRGFQKADFFFGTNAFDSLLTVRRISLCERQFVHSSKVGLGRSADCIERGLGMVWRLTKRVK